MPFFSTFFIHPIFSQSFFLPFTSLSHCTLSLFIFLKLDLQRNRRDTCNFDKEFTKMPVDLTPTDKLVIMNLDQDEFLGFSYTNPEYVAPAN